MEKLSFKGKYFTDPKNAVHISDKRTQDMIDSVLRDILKNEDEGFCFQATGDTMVIGFKFSDDDEINIIVTQNYSEACLLKDSVGDWYPIDWLENEEKEDLKRFTREELIEEILKLRHPDYNPRKEV